MNVTQSQKGSVVGTVNGGLAMSYSPEYRLAGTDDLLLQQLARTGKGRILTDAEQAFADNLPKESGQTPLWPWLLIMAAILLPLDIAARKLNIDWAGLREWLKSKLRSSAEEEVLSTVGRLREKKEEVKVYQERRVSKAEAAAVKEEEIKESLLPSQKPKVLNQQRIDEKGKPADHTARLLEAKRRLRK